MPQERMDARLQKQAEFINQFGEGLIWNNVIIVAKQPGVSRPIGRYLFLNDIYSHDFFSYDIYS